MRFLTGALFLLICLSHLHGQSILYVKHNATGANNGTSWANAYTDLQQALNNSIAGDEIWVSSGYYLPSEDKNGNINPSDPRDKTFHLKAGVSLFGGFSGIETTRAQDPALNPTILSGNIGSSSKTDNCYSVMYNSNVKTGITAIDGFIIEQGYSVNSTGNKHGGGLYDYNSKVNYSRIVFRNNSAQYGGGVGTGASSSTFYHCQFVNNQAISSGGGFMDRGVAVEIRHCFFKNNTCGGMGGGYMGLDADIDMAHCNFQNNSAKTGGGFALSSVNLNHDRNKTAKIYEIICENNQAEHGAGANVGCRPAYLANLTFRNNTASNGIGGMRMTGHIDISNSLFHNNTGGGLEVGINSFGNVIDLYHITSTHNNSLELITSDNSAVSLYNSILNGSISKSSASDIDYYNCLIPGSMPQGVWDVSLGEDKGGNIEGPPVFFSEPQRNFRLWKCSPGIDSGDNNHVFIDWMDFDNDNNSTEPTITDILSQSRINNSTVDIGAFEYNNTLFASSDSIHAYSLIDGASSYKWIDCSTDSVVFTGSSFQHQGDTSTLYALVIEKYGCKDTSECFKLDGVRFDIGIDEGRKTPSNDFIEIYPNPTTNLVYITCPRREYQTIEIYSLSGKLITTFDEEWKSKGYIELENLVKGVYIMRLNNTKRERPHYARIVRE